MKTVKTIWSVCPKDFDEKMNDFLTDITMFNGELNDIKYSATIKNNVVVVYTALVIYTAGSNERM